MAELVLFDSNAHVGYGNAPYPHRDESVGGVLRLMDRCGIARAAVYHQRCLIDGPCVGNARLMREIAPHRDRLEPVFVLVPAGGPELPDAPDTLARMAGEGVRLARLHPARHNYPPDPWLLSSLLDPLQARGMPLLLDKMDGTRWEAIHALATGWPGLPIVVTNVGYREDRSAFGLMNETTNVYLELGQYKPHLGIERLVQAFGAERLMFGTNAPYLTPGAAVASLMRAGLDGPVRRAIGAENLERLLAEVAP